MLYFALLGLAVALAVPLAAIGGALGQGKAASAALEGMARQPELQSKLQTSMLLGLAFVESLVIFAFLSLLILMGRLPATDAVLEAIKAGVK
jgi:F-type H+-transporting ATPase subunit c